MVNHFDMLFTGCVKYVNTFRQIMRISKYVNVQKKESVNQCCKEMHCFSVSVFVLLYVCLTFPFYSQDKHNDQTVELDL